MGLLEDYVTSRLVALELELDGFTARVAALEAEPKPVPPPAPEPVPLPPPVPEKFGIVRLALSGSQTPSVVDAAHGHRLVALAGPWMWATVAPVKAADPGCLVFCYLNCSRLTAASPAGNYNTLLSQAEALSNSYGVNWGDGILDAQDAWMRIVYPREPQRYAEFAGNVWTRHFEHGVVTFDQAAKTGVIS